MKCTEKLGVGTQLRSVASRASYQPLINGCIAITTVVTAPARMQAHRPQTNYLESTLIVFWFYGAMVAWFHLVCVVHSGTQLVGCWLLTVSLEVEARAGLDGG